MAVAKEQIRQIISENNISSVADVYTLLKDSFKDILQELMEAELDATLGYEKNQKGEDTFPLFKKALFYGGGISVVSGIGMSLLGKYVISILFGERYQDAVRYLPYVCMFVVPLTFVTILMNYVLAINKIKLFGISIAFGLVGIINLSLVMHEEVAYLMMLCGIVLSAVFICNIIWLMKDKKRR